VSEALEIQEIWEEFLREASFNLADLRTQVQLTYWSEQHFITQGLLKLLPFGEILSDICFYSYVDYSLDELVSKANSMLLYWRLSGVVQYDRTPLDQLSLFYNETFLWHYSMPSYWEEIHSQIQLGHRVRFLSQFLLSQTEIEVEFNKIRLQTNFDDHFQFVYTNSNTYQYKFANLRWQPICTILLFPLINPPTFLLPITVTNALRRETKYQAYLNQVQGLPNSIYIQDHYWDSVNSIPANNQGDRVRFAQFGNEAVWNVNPDQPWIYLQTNLEVPQETLEAAIPFSNQLMELNIYTRFAEYNGKTVAWYQPTQTWKY